jgi:hypothetical protein
LQRRRGSTRKRNAQADRSATRSPKSTAIEAQYDRTLRLLRIGKQSTLALRKAGVLMPAARIKELKDVYGYDIPTVERIDVWDDEGYCHPRIAVYELQGEPERAGQQ